MNFECMRTYSQLCPVLSLNMVTCSCLFNSWYSSFAGLHYIRVLIKVVFSLTLILLCGRLLSSTFLNCVCLLVSWDPTVSWNLLGEICVWFGLAVLGSWKVMAVFSYTGHLGMTELQDYNLPTILGWLFLHCQCLHNGLIFCIVVRKVIPSCKTYFQILPLMW